MFEICSGCVLKISRFAGDRIFCVTHLFDGGVPVGRHIGVALFQAEFSVANGFAHGLGAVSEDKGFSKVLVSIVCHECLLFLLMRSDASWKLNGA
jgi:hypothetical protein